MSLKADIAAFNGILNASIANAMRTNVYAHARDCISAVVWENVYEQYEPQGRRPYQRRYSEGGLLDPRNNEIVEEDTFALPDGYQLVVRNMTQGVDGEYEIDQLIERGYPYSWEYSVIHRMEPYPRPFYKDAEKKMVSEGYFEKALKDGMQAAGIDFWQGE